MKQRYSKKIRDIANKIKTTEDEFGFITTLMIISIILTTIRIFQECNKNKIKELFKQKNNSAQIFMQQEINSYSIKKTWYSTIRLKRIIKSIVSPNDYKKYQKELVNKIYSVGSNLTSEEVKVLMEAANYD